MTFLRKSFPVVLVLVWLTMGWLAPPHPVAAELTIPESPAGQQLSWALDQITTAAAGTTEVAGAQRPQGRRRRAVDVR